MSANLFGKEFSEDELRDDKNHKRRKPSRKSDDRVLELADEEIEQIYLQFKTFVSSINGLALFPHIKEFVIDLAIALNGTKDIVKGKLTAGQTSHSQELIDYVRGTILEDVKKKYEEEG